MKRWEHARLIVRLTGEKRFNRITLFGPKGPKDGPLILGTRQKEVPLAKEPGEWSAMDRAIADLGGEGWEMVGVTQLSVGPSADDQEWHFWFKRPLQES
jgi:hypothetical protein